MTADRTPAALRPAPRGRSNRTAASALRVLIPGLCAVGFGASPVFAQEDGGVSGFVYFGPGVSVDYEGADEYYVIPGFAGQIEYEGRSVTIQGFDIDTDLLPSQRFTLGPSLTYRFAREDLEDDKADRLDDVDAATEIGVNAAVNFGELMRDGDGLSLGVRLMQDVADGHDGFVGKVGADYMTPVTERLRLSTGLSLSFASDDYADAYFDVSAQEAARSGLSAYDAEGGLKDVSLSFGLDYSLSERWGVGAIASYSRLVGDFADSSIVDEAGSPDQFFGLVGVQYRF